MQKKSGHLTSEERHVLYAYIQEELSLRNIKRRMGRSISTWSDEINGNGGRSNYDPAKAHFRAQLKRWEANCKNPRKNERVWSYVRMRLEEGLSPDQISGRIKEDYPEDRKMRISHETIYQFINSIEGRALDLAKCLRRKKFRKLRKGRMQHLTPKKIKILNRTPIQKRPKVIKHKKRYGDFESDLMEGKKKTKAVLSVQKERRSQYVCLKKVTDKTANENNRAIKENLSIFPQAMLCSLTYDNGSENAKHEEINDHFNMKSYFCDPYASWQKGGVENIIGLIREYLPKGTDLTKVTDEEIQVIQDRLNNRPRKSLGYKTPKEVLSKYLKTLGVRF